MLDPVLPPECYTQQSWFDLEQEHIFGKLWIFFGLTQQLQSENSFITRTIAGVPILVQRLGGELRAFRNACAHRGMPIQVEVCGNRKLICPYHAWSYRNDGALHGVPNSNLYGLCEKQHLKLEPYVLEVLGNFVFVNLSPTPLPIEQQFSSDLRRCLEHLSGHFAEEVSYTSFSGEYNWKLNFENVLDWNHVQFVHENTFSPLVNYKEAVTSSGDEREESLLFGDNGPLADIRFKRFSGADRAPELVDISWIGRIPMNYYARWYSELLASSFDKGSLFSAHIFPNLNFGCIHGESFYLQQYMPLAPGRIEYHSWVFTSRLKPGVPRQPHLLWGIHHAEKRVIDEDVRLFKVLQKALTSAHHSGVMGDYEHRQHTMGRWYMNALGAGRLGG